MSDNIDLESLPKGGGKELTHFSWKGLTVTVKDSKTKLPLDILRNIDGSARPGDMVALMGPSGSGKTTLLNVLARRPAAASASVKGQVLLDNAPLQAKMLREISTYVEQEDALIGSLTVQETIEFAARLSGAERHAGRVAELIRAFGLVKQAHTKIGTPIAKGISGGQKRRASIASQLITRPRILFLDEPTSGLDSKAAYEVMYRIQQVAKDENMIVIASIHQPTTATFNLFSQLVLLSGGRVVYSGATEEVVPYFSSQGVPIPALTNPAEFLLDICNTDFDNNSTDVGGVESRVARLDRLLEAWSPSADQVAVSSTPFSDSGTIIASTSPTSVLWQTFVLLQRLWLKSYRDLLAYWIRVIMYLGLAFMMGTVWLRLGRSQDNIQPFINAIFFSGAFMSFMAVAYIPAYLEDQDSFRKERANGLYGPTSFLLSNFLIGIPFIFLIALMFSLVTVYLCNFNQTPEHFFRYAMWLFLDLLAAESLVILVSSLVPVFVAALAITAFANGLWMSVSGFLVSPRVLNVFWYYTFYWIDYQRYVFEGMMFNEFDGRVYECARLGDGSCQCMYPSALSDRCEIEGRGVLTALGFGEKRVGLWIGVLLAVIFVLRGLAWVTLKVRAH